MATAKRKVDEESLEIKKVGKPSDLYIRIGKSRIDKKHQFYLTHSEVYDCDEYVWRGKLTADKVISFARGDGRKVPDPHAYNQISGPGITLNGANACDFLKPVNAISCPVEGEDISYNFVSDQSSLVFKGKSNKLYTIFIRIYDNNTGNDNDRWIVVSIE